VFDTTDNMLLFRKQVRRCASRVVELFLLVPKDAYQRYEEIPMTRRSEIQNKNNNYEAG
jgi:hypothetical protein